jgi:plasmid stabilization system protein ParE
MEPVYRLTPRAYSDLKEIGRYTLRKWVNNKETAT